MILNDAIPVDRFRKNDKAVLDRPADQNLGRRLVVRRADRNEGRIVELATLGEWAVGLDNDLVLPTPLHRVKASLVEIR